MSASKLKYIAVFISPAVVFLSMYLGHYWVFLAPIYVFGIIPFLELFTPGTQENLAKAEEEIVKNDRFYDYLLYAMVPIQLGLMVYFFYALSTRTIPVWEQIGMAIAFGMSCGALGINMAHELGHRHTRYEQLMSKILLATTQYLHFFIEHNRGHHKNVSTDEDPASARYGEMVYTFYFRSIIGSWLSAWKLESERLRKHSQSFWSFHNEMLVYQIIQLSMLLAIGYFAGLQILALYGIASLTGILLLETVNYIEHYGLRRKKVGDAYYEKTMPAHSWNSNHTLGRILLLELTRHSDHHYMANRKYQVLRHFEDSPQMPAGYPAMMLLSLFPPLWFYVMHKEIDTYKKTKEGKVLA